MHTMQAKTSNPKPAAKTAEPTPKAASSGTPIHLPAWTSAWGDNPSVGLLLPDTVPALQTKLTVNQPGDPYEREADRVADQVMRMPDSAVSVQGKCACGGTSGTNGECEECASRRLPLQRRSVTQSEPPPVPPIVHKVVSRGNGHPLESSTRALMESRFGYDFSQVRVHSDSRAAESAEAVNALAYAVGQNVVFGAGRYAPGMTEGKRLLAHELTHVVQQGGENGYGGNISQLKHTPGIQRQHLPGISPGELRAPDISGLEPAMPEIPHFELTMPTPPPFGTIESLVIDHFAVNSAVIPRAFNRQLDHLASLLNIYREVQVHIEGHTDSTYTREYNQRLSERRAEAVKEALVRWGVDAGRLITQGFGEDRLLFREERTAEEKARNRRVEVWFHTEPSRGLVPQLAVPIIPITWRILGGGGSPSPPPGPPTPTPAPLQEAPESRWRVTMQFTPQVPIRIVGTPTLSPMACDYFAFPVGVMRNWEGWPAGNRWHFLGQPEFDLDFFPTLCRGHWPSLVLQDNIIKLTIIDKILEATLVAGLSMQQGNTPSDWSLVVQPAAGQLAWHPFGHREVWYREFQVLFNAGLNWTIPFAGPPPGPLPPNTLDVVLGVGVRLELPH